MRSLTKHANTFRLLLPFCAHPTGQRKYGGPPPNWTGNTPGNGCEVFCGKIPKDMYEDELIPLFEKCGKIWDLRLMMDPMTGTNRGYAFVTFTSRDAASNAVREVSCFVVFPISDDPSSAPPAAETARPFVAELPSLGRTVWFKFYMSDYYNLTTPPTPTIYSLYTTTSVRSSSRLFLFLYPIFPAQTY